MAARCFGCACRRRNESAEPVTCVQTRPDVTGALSEGMTEVGAWLACVEGALPEGAGHYGVLLRVMRRL